MLTRVTLPLERTSSGYPDDVSVVEFLSQLGFELKRQTSAGIVLSDEVDIIVNGATIKIKVGSNEYFRELARRNLSASVPEIARNELEKYGLYFGAIASFRTYIGVVRTVESEVTFLIIQEKFDVMLNSCEKLFEHIDTMQRKITLFKKDEMYSGNCKAELMSASESKLLTSAFLTNSKLTRYISDRRIEIAILAISVVVLLVCFCLDAVPAQSGIDPFPVLVRAFISKAWPSLSISTLLLFITLAISFHRFERRRFIWKWS